MSEARRLWPIGALTALVLALPVLCAAQPAGADGAAGADESRAAASDARADEGNVVERMQARLSRLNDRGIYPRVGIITAGAGLGAGGALRRSRFGNTPIGGEVEAMWSIRAYHRYGVRLGWIRRQPEIRQLRPADLNVTSLVSNDRPNARGAAAYVEAWHRRSPRLTFYGVGPDAADARTDFALNATVLDGVAAWQPAPAFGVSARVGLLDIDVGQGRHPNVPNLEDRFTVDEAPGLLQRPRYFTAGIGAAAGDAGAEPARRGWTAAAALWRFEPLNDDLPAFTRAAIDGRVYQPVTSDRHVVAARAVVAADRSTADALTPFYLQYTLGGSSLLRGFSSYRFWGNALWHVSTEWRWRVARYVQVAPFLDVGTVAPRFRDLARGPRHVSPGVGLRLVADDRVFFRIDYARSADGHRFAFDVGEAF
jgi:hypothetical protein